MAKQRSVQLAANFERNLADIEQFLCEAEAPQAYDALIDQLLGTVIPNLEQFPDIGRRFLARSPGSAETTNALDGLRAKLLVLTADSNALREYIFSDYLVLYAQIDGVIYLLAIKHHRQLSFDFDAQWRG
jgi:hypothetical protein